MVAVHATSAKPVSVAIIAAPVAVGVVLVLCLLLILICWRRQKRKKLQGRGKTVRMIPVGNTRNDTSDPLTALEASLEESEREVVSFDQNDRINYQQLFGSKVILFVDLEIGDCLGQGAFGKVLKGTLVRGNGGQEDVAMKTLRNFSSKDAQKEFFSESLIMKDFQHPNVLGLVGVCLDSPNHIPYLVLPFMENGNLKEYLKSRRVHVTDFETMPKGLGVVDLVRMCSDIVQGMQYLARNRFVHRDLAARNCMVSASLQVKVSDFGLTRDVYSTDYYRASQNAKLPVKWMPLETLQDGISNEKTDVWAYGVTCWEVFSLGRTPYPGVPNYDILKFITRGERLDRPVLCPEELFDEVLSICWAEKAEERPMFNELAPKIDKLQCSISL